VEKVCLEHSKYDQLTCQFDPELEIKKLVRFHRSIFYNTCSIIFLCSLGEYADWKKLIKIFLYVVSSIGKWLHLLLIYLVCKQTTALKITTYCWQFLFFVLMFHFLSCHVSGT